MHVRGKSHGLWGCHRHNLRPWLLLLRCQTMGPPGGVAQIQGFQSAGKKVLGEVQG